jgi:hypothetical protein
MDTLLPETDCMNNMSELSRTGAKIIFIEKRGFS